MKFSNLKKWDKPEKSRGLLFLAQVLEELLFDFSLDTYKPSVMTTSGLCIETLVTIKEVSSGNIKRPNISHVIAELCGNLDKDIVAKDIVNLDSGSVFSVLKDPKSNDYEVRTVVEILASQLSPSKYKSACERLLIGEVTGAEDFSRLRSLARAYVTTLISIGYSSSYLYRTCIDFFYHGKNRIAGPEAIRDFIAIFSGKSSKYRVIYRANAQFKTYSKACSDVDIEIKDDIPDGKELISKFHHKIRADETYLVVNGVEACDPNSAKEGSDERIKLILTLATLFHHKTVPKWMDECVVQNLDEKYARKIKRNRNPMHKCRDATETSAAHKLEALIKGFSLEDSSFLKFIRSAELHSLALSSESKENQMLNLWISLESLIPAEAKHDEYSNIEHIINSLIPFLNINYIERLLYRLASDVMNWNPSIAKLALKDVPGKKLPERIARILSLKDYEKNLGILEGGIRDFHLLRDRIDYFRRVLSSPSNVASALDAHKQRLEWQIRRLYRTRNLIVHSGNTPAYTQTLIEHMHDYLDSVLATLVRLASKPKMIDSVSQGFAFVYLNYEAYYKGLSKKGGSFSEENIDSLLFRFRVE